MRDPIEASENQYLNEQYGEDNEIACARCGMAWEEEMGMNDFGCWSCGNTWSVAITPAGAMELMHTYNQSQQAATKQQTKAENN